MCEQFLLQVERASSSCYNLLLERTSHAQDPHPMNSPQVRATRAKSDVEAPRCFTACSPSQTHITSRVWYHESFWRGRAGDRERDTDTERESKASESARASERARVRERQQEQRVKDTVSEQDSE